MPERRVTVVSPVGLHARPAAVFVRAVRRTGVAVTIAKGDGRPVDARSLLAIMTLDVHHGDEVVLATADSGGPAGQTDAALDSLAALLRTDLGATESASEEVADA
jgi:phosphocarrier protein